MSETSKPESKTKVDTETDGKGKKKGVPRITNRFLNFILISGLTFLILLFPLIIAIYVTLYTDEEIEEYPSTIKLYGNVQIVLAGEITEEVVTTVDDLEFALGLGSVSGKLEEMGEVIGVNGEYFLKTVDPNINYAVRKGKKIHSPFLMGLRHDEVPKEYIMTRNLNSLEDIYRNISKRYDIFAVVGVGHFRDVFTTAVKKAPIYKERVVSEEFRKDYFHPVSNLGDQKAVFFGIVINMDISNDPTYSPYVDRMFYVNFANSKTSSNIQSHTHIGFVEDLTQEFTQENHDVIINDMKNSKISDVHHLLTQTKVEKGLIMIYPIEGIYAN